MHFRLIRALAAFTAICFLSCHGGGNPADLRSRVREVRLDNGMTFLLLKRGGAPVFSVQLNVRTGGIEDPPGGSGLAHFFEHMAFKGTDKLGSKDFSREKPVLERILEVGTAIVELEKSGRPESEIRPLIEKRRALEAEENRYVAKNEFFNVLVREGANDLNAMTNSDMTMYIASLPSNKFALWSYWESQRLTNRVFREFFAEKDVVAEERRMSVDNDPEGRLYEAVLGVGFKASPYRMMTIGTQGDIRSYTPAQAKAFYEKYYIPSRMVAAVVGNFDLDAAEAVIRKDFGSIPKRDDSAEVFPTEAFVGSVPRKAVVTADSEPRFILGYHRPAWPHPDDAVMDVVEDLLCEGETSRLVKNLIYRDQVVVGLDCSASFPGERLDSLFTMFVIPAPGRSNAEAAAAVRAEIRELAEAGPTDLELQTARNNDEADLVYAMESNDGLADVLAYHHALTGDWRDMYAMRDAFARVGSDDVKRALKTYFTPEREVEADLEPLATEGKR